MNTREIQDLIGSINTHPIERNVDIVFVIDASKSMEALIQGLQQRADSLYDEFLEACAYNVKSINRIKFKVIWYQDFFIDGDDTYGESGFFEMPDERMRFNEYLNSIRACGGSNYYRPGLAVLSSELSSDFVQEGDKRCHIIIHFTDAASYTFEKMKNLKEKCQINNDMIVKVLEDIPNGYEGFLCKWEECKYPNLDKLGKRLLLIAPEVYPWDVLEVELDYTMRMPINDVAKINWKRLIDVISYSVL